MSNKMLIDASHPEETRVAVVRGNRIEEFDFESQEKKQLRGNIYLAKVTRVEPSLQAAFIDYGGNRHGFLAFSEIHPDYYQIPVADRQALLEAEAEEARASREEEDAEEEASTNVDEEEVEEARPKRKSRRRSSKKAAPEEAGDSEVAETQNAEADEATQNSEEASTSPAKTDASDTEEANTDPEEEVVAAKPKRRTPRRKKPKTDETSAATSGSSEPAETIAETTPSEPTEQLEELAQADSNSDDTAASDEENASDSDDPTTMAAAVETDSISEPLPGDEEEVDSENADEDNSDTVSEEAEATEATQEAPQEEEKPKKRRVTRSRKKKAELVSEETTEAKTESGEDDTPQEAETTGTVEETTSEVQEQPEEEEKEKPAKPRRRSRRKKAAAPEMEEAPDSSPENLEDTGENDDSDDDDVESVGQDDALEEAASPRKIRRQYKIQEVIKRRQVLLVQVVKEERGNKGAALTTYLSLAGRYSVLMPNTARGGGISRKITNAADRKRLKSIATELDVPEGMGVILRTAGAARTKVEIERDFQYLMRLWEQVRSLTLSSTAPCLVYEEGSLIKRSIRDLYHKDTGEVVVSGERGYKEACEFMGMLMPNRVKKVKEYKGSQAIFTKYGVDAQLDNMVSPQVTLKSGGYLVINQTEALVAVDVNSGRATREHSIENTALQTNLEAAEEVARQLRLRDLAGLIVIDFIDMEERRNNRAVEKKLKDCLKNDRARIQVGRISHFGLLEMSRQRIRASVLESTMDACPHCAGVGYVRSESAIALHVFRALEEHVSRNRKWDANVRTTPDIAAHILNHKRSALVELEQKFGVQIMVLGDHTMNGQQFEIEKGERARKISNQTAIGYDGDSVDNGAEAIDQQEESEGRGNKRNRRRNRKDQPVDESDTAEAELIASDQQPSESTNENEDTAEEAPRKKRRRGNRGGRRRKASGVETDVEENDASKEAEGNSGVESTDSVENDASVPTSSDVTVGEPSTSEVDVSPSAVTSEEPDEKPKSRSTRRKKAPIAPKPQVSEVTTEEKATEAVAEPAPASQEPARPKRRTTRRKPAAETNTEMSAANESDENEVKVETPSDPEPKTTDKPKRSGWWSRGGGFF